MTLLERRRSRRIPRTLKFRLTDQAGTHEVYTLDVSMVGAFIVQKRALPVGSFIILDPSFTDPSSPSIRLLAKVIRWVPPGSGPSGLPGIGVQWIKCECKEGAKVLAKFLSSYLTITLDGGVLDAAPATSSSNGQPTAVFEFDSKEVRIQFGTLAVEVDYRTGKTITRNPPPDNPGPSPNETPTPRASSTKEHAPEHTPTPKPDLAPSEQRKLHAVAAEPSRPATDPRAVTPVDTPPPRLRVVSPEPAPETTKAAEKPAPEPPTSAQPMSTASDDTDVGAEPLDNSRMYPVSFTGKYKLQWGETEAHIVGINEEYIEFLPDPRKTPLMNSQVILKLNPHEDTKSFDARVHGVVIGVMNNPRFHKMTLTIQVTEVVEPRSKASYRRFIRSMIDKQTSS